MLAPQHESGTDSLGKMRGNGGGLRWDPQIGRTENLVSATRDGLIRRGYNTEQHIERRRLIGQLFRAFNKKTTGSVV